MEKHVFIIGSKGIPARYGGYETFVEQLTRQQQDQSIKYHVACKVTKWQQKNKRFRHNGADCFNVYVPQIGAAQAIYYDIVSFKKCLRYVKEHNIEKPVFYILACRIGPFMHLLAQKAHKIGGKVFLNPDGHEWLRAKWSCPVRKYWKFSERLMVKNSDLIICDSKNIEKYIKDSYIDFRPETIYIAYGANVYKSKMKDEDNKLQGWFHRFGIQANNYYLIVGRFVPENNYETMISEFMESKTDKDLVIITNTKGNSFFNYLKEKTNFDKDQRIKFVGTVYDPQLLKKIRELAFAYLHGHSVGGTNPSLLEALASTKLNLLYDVGFNREVAQNSAKYWNKTSHNLARLINTCDSFSQDKINNIGSMARDEVINNFLWKDIIFRYERRFLK